MMEERKQAMKKYVIRRILSGILTIFIVFTLTFILIKSAPGDPIRTLLGQDNDDPVLQAALEEKWGLNKSLPEQYLWLNREEDMGIPGLRQAKTSYHPAKLLEKCRAVKIK